ncbi:hypothetical protein ACFVAE_08225 [Microbacterium sp. NPDC057659]|uniref:hypothetical protein n=1 Tax=Microbacterium sp. NPDC057659 TaxID=3346198 RepID=UPI0036712621
MKSTRILHTTSALAAGVLLMAGLAGCAQSPAGPASSAPAPTSTSGSSPDAGDVEVAWLDEGRSFAVVTYGSSTCVPQMQSVSSDGQTVEVTLADVDQEAACTSDLAPRASLSVMPVEVDVTKDVEVKVVYGDLTDDAELDALPAEPAGATSMKPSAGWFDDSGIALLTWGSSSCPPIVSGVEQSDAGATVTFAESDRVCTMDMAPRVTLIGLEQPVDDDAAFALTLTGDNLSGTVDVMR